MPTARKEALHLQGTLLFLEKCVVAGEDGKARCRWKCIFDEDCDYVGEKKYHAKCHVKRIHFNGGRPCRKKRKHDEKGARKDIMATYPAQKERKVEQEQETPCGRENEKRLFMCKWRCGSLGWENMEDPAEGVSLSSDAWLKAKAKGGSAYSFEKEYAFFGKLFVAKESHAYIKIKN
jgi:hypothetical protein